MVLQGHEAGQALLPCRPLRLFEFRRGEVGAADRADLAFADELVQRRQRLRDRGDPVGLVVLVEVDAVGAQPPQRLLDGAADVLARAARGGGAPSAPLISMPNLVAITNSSRRPSRASPISRSLAPAPP